MASEPITPTRLRRAQRELRDARALNVATLQAFLAVRREIHTFPTDRLPGKLIVAWEDASAAWGDASRRHRTAKQRLAKLSLCEVVKGAHVSPAARARLIANRTWRQDK